MDEFDLIAKYLRPLVQNAGADQLRDDVAELITPADSRIIVTTDALVEGVHFLPDDPLEATAKKLVRVNVSDCIAKGGRPFAASLTIMWPETRPEADFARFAAGLGEDLRAWSIDLLGGDTVSTPGPLSVSLTLHGHCRPRGPVRRSGGRAGDDLWVTGDIGLGRLGLLAATGRLAGVADADLQALVQAYRTPTPPVISAADLVAEVASASIDVSDGLIADARHLATASGVSIDICLNDVPVPGVASAWFAEIGAVRGRIALATGGDDYQTLFAASSAAASTIRSHDARATKIGVLADGEGVRVLSDDGAEIAIEDGGWRHFSASS